MASDRSYERTCDVHEDPSRMDKWTDMGWKFAALHFIEQKEQKEQTWEVLLKNSNDDNGAAYLCPQHARHYIIPYLLQELKQGNMYSEIVIPD